MDKREILVNLKIAHEQLLKKNYKNGRLQIGIMIKCIEDDFRANVLCEGKESPDDSGNCNKPDVRCGNSNKIRLEKLDPMGNVIETIELDGRWLITTGEKSYFMTNRYVDELKVGLEKIQKNFVDNL